MSEEDQKRVLKEALKEWLDEKYSTFGRWAFWSLAAAGLFALCYFILTTNGWKAP